MWVDSSQYIEEGYVYLTPIRKCSYCESEDCASLALCLCCRRWFCNGSFGSQNTAHIVLHMARARHFEVALLERGREGWVERVVRCSYCGVNRNAFSLGGSSLVNLRCRGGCGGGVGNRERRALTEAELNAVPPMIVQKKFVEKFLSPQKSPKVENLVLAAIERLELAWREEARWSIRDFVRDSAEDSGERRVRGEKIPSEFESSREYVRVFGEMLRLEYAATRKLEELENSLLVVGECWWDPVEIGRVELSLSLDRVRVQEGQEVQLILENFPETEMRTKWSAEVAAVRGRTALVLVVQDVEGLEFVPRVLGPGMAYRLDASIWTDVVFERMRKAVEAVRVCERFHTRLAEEAEHGLASGRRGEYGRVVMPRTVMEAIVYGDCGGGLGLPAPTVAEAREGGELVPFVPSEKLNESQNRAVAMALRNPFSLIQGPPGTGKSTVCVEIVGRAVRDGKVLVCAPSNIVADDLAEKISRMHPGVDVVRVAARSREEVECRVTHLMLHVLCAAMDKEYKQKRNKLKRGGLKPKQKAALLEYCRRVEMARLSKAQVMVMTCVCAGDSRVAGFSFPTVVVDEATQTVEPGCLIPVVLSSKRVVLVGDHKQLGPVVHNLKAKSAGFDISMFERLVGGRRLPMTRLDVQYRMHPAISEFPCNQFYNGTLVDGVSAVSRTKSFPTFPWPNPKFPVFFWHIPGQEELDCRGTSYLNRHEALKVEELVSLLLKDSRDVGVITFYTAQKELLSLKHPSGTPEIASVDGFQGREKDFIILSTVRVQEIGFLREFRRLNVAITRAKFGLIICGNVRTLAASKDDTWLALLNFLDGESAIFVGSSVAELIPAPLSSFT